MTGKELAKLRRSLNLTKVQFGQELGYGGSDDTIQRIMQRYETGNKDIPDYIARLAFLLSQWVDDCGSLPEWPE